ncbi:MAG: hypothetical protein RR512_03500 [Coprobacillus sp.]
MIILLVWICLLIYGFFCLSAIKNNTYETKKVLDEILKELQSQNNNENKSL